MRELPILLNGEMVRATMEGRKTTTRRPVKPQPRLAWDDSGDWLLWKPGDGPISPHRLATFNPHGVPGDLLYVRETTRKWGEGYGQYCADLTPVIGPPDHWPEYPMASRRRAVWWYSRDVCPSIHMPKEYARLWLRNTGNRIERVQSITPADCEAEGIVGKTLSSPVRGQPYEEYTNGDGITYTEPRIAFAAQWDSIYAKRGLGWNSNCWVWVTSYEVTER